MKIRYDNKRVTKKVREIPLGAVFSGSPTGINKIYLKALDRAIDLQNPETCWSNSVSVYDYVELDTELLVKGEK